MVAFWRHIQELCPNVVSRQTLNLKFDINAADPEELDNPTFTNVENALEQLDSTNRAFVILENGENGYMQCAGRTNECCVELRVNIEDSFKHWIIGKGETTSPLKTVWHVIKSKVGPIRVKKEEQLDLSDAKILFSSYLNNEPLPQDYYKRNVTKLYGE